MMRYQLEIIVDTTTQSLDGVNDSVVVGRGVHHTAIDRVAGTVLVFGEGMAGVSSLQALTTDAVDQGYAVATKITRIGSIAD
jgi:hypothetical protein